MRYLVVLLPLIAFSAGCERLLMRTQSRISFGAPVDTRLTDISPVSPIAGPVRPVIVERGAGNARVAIVDVDGLILNTPFAGPMSVGENPVAFFREKLDAIEPDPCVKAVVL